MSLEIDKLDAAGDPDLVVRAAGVDEPTVRSADNGRQPARTARW
jgi:hypothetical protein